MAKRKEISFQTTQVDGDLIALIADRAELAGLIFRGYDRMHCVMDLTAVHANGNPLRLYDLLNADDFNFAHDICGIARHLDRDTGKLGGFFSPRFSRRRQAEPA